MTKSTAEIRSAFLNYFQSQKHQIVSSSSLVPHDDPTLLFTNAGMNQFKDVFLGSDKRNYSRAVSSQRCVRAGGKHNDLENVGYTDKMLQEEAVNGTVQALERSDAFDPILDQSVYNQSASNEPQNIDMCKACDALYESTAPLFLALHRLPQGGEMYLPLVGESVYKQCFCRLNSLHFLSL